MGTGHEIQTRQLLNESKNHVFGLILTGNPYGSQVQVPVGVGVGCPEKPQGNPQYSLNVDYQYKHVQCRIILHHNEPVGY